METEPFIVKRSLNEDAEEIFVSTDERFLIEKDLQGCQLDRLDMKCVTYMSLLKKKGQTVVKLKFNYVKSNRRERTYVMIDENEADVSFYLTFSLKFLYCFCFSWLI